MKTLRSKFTHLSAMLTMAVVVATTSCNPKAKEEAPSALTEAQIEDLVKRSYQYVAMYNVNNKFADQQGGWNTVVADTKLKDHTLTDIARPNNDTLYISCLLDLREAPLVIEMPEFDSDYVSLMITGYDHYVNVPMSTRQGNFKKPEKMLLFSGRTQGYEKGQTVEGIDRYFEATGDFISAVFRVMPHANDRDRFERIVEQMNSVKLTSLPEMRGEKVNALDPVEFPPVGERDADIFENNLLAVMQFVFNHTSFDPENELDQAILAAYAPLGIAPGNSYNPDKVGKIDGKQIRAVSERIAQEQMAKMNPSFIEEMGTALFQPKGEVSLEALLLPSVVGPIGLPAQEALYPPISCTDGKPMNAQHDYVIRMTKDNLPPAKAFWSTTLYDLKNGFFIPNDYKKYSVGKNGGMKLNADGGIEIYIAAEKPESVPEENWLPINRGDYAVDVIMRLYVPDLAEFENWTPPQAEKL